MVCVYTAANVVHLYLIRGVLEHEGIAGHIRNEYGVDAGMWPTPHAWPELWVGEVDAPKAQQILARVESRQDEDGRLSIAWKGGELSLAPTDAAAAGPVACPACGAEWEPGFELCWSCEHELP